MNYKYSDFLEKVGPLLLTETNTKEQNRLLIFISQILLLGKSKIIAILFLTLITILLIEQTTG